MQLHRKRLKDARRDPPEEKTVNHDAYGYSAAVRSGGFLFVWGQVGVDDTGSGFPYTAKELQSAGKCFRAIWQRLHLLVKSLIFQQSPALDT